MNGAVVLAVVDITRAGQRVHAVDIHGARTADTFATRAPEGDGRVDFVLDFDQGIKNHWPTIIEVDLERIDTWVLSVVCVPTIDIESLYPRRTFGRVMGDAFGDLRVCREAKFDHLSFP